MKKQVVVEEDERFSSELLFRPSNSCGSTFTQVKPHEDQLVFELSDKFLISQFEVKSIAQKSLIAYYPFTSSRKVKFNPICGFLQPGETVQINVRIHTGIAWRISSIRIYLKLWPLSEDFAIDKIKEYRANQYLYFQRHNINMMFTTHAFDCSHHLTKEVLMQFPKVDEIKQVHGRAFAHPSMAIPKMKMLPGTVKQTNQPPAEENIENISSQNLLSKDELNKNNLINDSIIPEENIRQEEIIDLQESFNPPNLSKETEKKESKKIIYKQSSNNYNTILKNNEQMEDNKIQSIENNIKKNNNKFEMENANTHNKVAMLMKAIRRPESQEQNRVSKVNNFILSRSEKLLEDENKNLMINSSKKSNS